MAVVFLNFFNFWQNQEFPPQGVGEKEVCKTPTPRRQERDVVMNFQTLTQLFVNFFGEIKLPALIPLKSIVSTSII
ncbi:hypothetical protein HYU17_01340 [Candidatus Woesearchaeota archaeon]|nr:hypothetical protein [Candidatus Woesearchaeota archaeon]